MRLKPLNRFKHSSKSIFTDRSNAVLLLWIVFVGYASGWCVLFFVAKWSPAGKGLTSGCRVRFVLSLSQMCPGLLVHIRIKGEAGAVKLVEALR